MVKNVSKRKILVKIILVILVVVLLPTTYFLFATVKAYFDTPRIVSRFYLSDKVKLKIEDLGENYRNILLKVEDPNFYNHNGIDLKTPGAGYTTITQAIVKACFFSEGFSPGFLRYRKIKQSLIAIVFNNKVDKNTQLEMFINIVYLGDYQGKEVIGLEDGAKTYFKKNFKALTQDEYIALIAMIIAPNDLNVINQPEKNLIRVNKIKGLIKAECKPLSLTDVYYEDCPDH